MNDVPKTAAGVCKFLLARLLKTPLFPDIRLFHDVLTQAGELAGTHLEESKKEELTLLLKLSLIHI